MSTSLLSTRELTPSRSSALCIHIMEHEEHLFEDMYDADDGEEAFEGNDAYVEYGGRSLAMLLGHDEDDDIDDDEDEDNGLSSEEEETTDDEEDLNQNAQTDAHNDADFE